MRRREFIAGVASAAAAWPLAAMGQQADRMRRVGWLEAGAGRDEHSLKNRSALLELLSKMGWIEGHSLSEQLQPLASNRRLGAAETGCVALGTSNVLHEAIGGSVTAAGEDNRNCLRRSLRSARRGRSRGHNHVRRKRHKLRSRRPQSNCVVAAEAVVEFQAVPLDPSHLGK